MTQELVWALWRREESLSSTVAQTPDCLFRSPFAIPPTLVQFPIKKILYSENLEGKHHLVHKTLI